MKLDVFSNQISDGPSDRIVDGLVSINNSGLRRELDGDRVQYYAESERRLGLLAEVIRSFLAPGDHGDVEVDLHMDAGKVSVSAPAEDWERLLRGLEETEAEIDAPIEVHPNDPIQIAW
ncbi:MAG: hypothetical protein AAGA70_01920 [Pseudomonadota bacterium]